MVRSLVQRYKRSASWLLTLAGAFGLYVVTRDLHWSLLAESARQTAMWTWMVSLGGLMLSHGLRAGRIRSEWRGRLHMSWRTAWALTVRHAAWIVLSPLRTGEAIYVWALHRQGGVDLGTAARSLVKLRMQDLAVLLLWTLLLAGPGQWPLRLMICAVILVLLVVYLPRWLSLMPMTRFLGRPAASVQLGHGSRSGWAYALLNWPVKFMALALPLQALSGLEARSAWVAVAGGEWAALIPVQPIAGFGTYEAGVVASARWMEPASIAVVAAAALFVHVLSLGVTVGSAWLAHSLGWSDADLRISVH